MVGIGDAGWTARQVALEGTRMSESEHLAAELQREREARATLEARLERAESRVREMESSQRQESAAEDMAATRLQHVLLGAAPTEESPDAPSGGMQSWLFEARMNSVDVAAQVAPVYAKAQPAAFINPIMASSEPAASLETASDAALDGEVQRLRAELLQARQTEAAARERLQEMESRLDTMASTPEKPAAFMEPAPEVAAPEVPEEAPEEDVAQLSSSLSVPELEKRVRPGDVLADESAAPDDLPLDPLNGDAEASYVSPLQDAEAEEALQNFARAVQGDAEAAMEEELVASVEEIVEETPASMTELQADTALQEPFVPEEISTPIAAEETLDRSPIVPSAIPFTPERSAFSEQVQAWGTRATEHADAEETMEASASDTPKASTPLDTPDQEIIEEQAPPQSPEAVEQAADEVEAVSQSAPPEIPEADTVEAPAPTQEPKAVEQVEKNEEPLPQPGRPEDRTDAIVQALQRFMGKKKS
jgi:hypothetical protein